MAEEAPRLVLLDVMLPGSPYMPGSPYIRGLYTKVPIGSAACGSVLACLGAEYARRTSSASRRRGHGLQWGRRDADAS